MKIALSAGSTPNGVGIAYNSRNVYVVSGCCSDPVNTVYEDCWYQCANCGTEVLVTFPFGKWMTEIELVNPFTDLLSVDGPAIVRWLAAWTGASEEQINCEITTEEL